MLFNSFEFLVFFPLVIMVYFVLPVKWRWIWLLISSYYFYMCWNPVYILLLLFSTGVSYVGGRLLGKIHTEEKRKIVLGLAVIINFSVLFWFKYLNFFCYTCNQVLQRFSIDFRLPEYDILLPVGISFFTFQAVGYVIDVYKGIVSCETNFLRYALFVSFFPQLVAGPIERSGNLMYQLHEDHRFSWERVKDGLVLMLWGFFLKLVVADRAAIVVNSIWENPDKYQGCYILVALFLFAFQIYGDFAGYSTIAQGAAKVLDIRLMDNFKAPYLSQSVTEFWRNWHISLSSWFRDYVYIPLGGNRKGKLRKYANIMIVFAGSGLWHGAAWNYVVWGIINGFYQVVEDICKKGTGKLFRNDRNRRSAVRVVVQTALTFMLVDFSWLFFRAGSLSEAMRMIKSICLVHNPKIFFDGSLLETGLLRGEWILLLLSILLVLMVDSIHRQGKHMRALLAAKSVWIRWIIYTVLFWTVVMFGIYGVNYEASAFIYFQF